MPKSPWPQARTQDGPRPDATRPTTNTAVTTTALTTAALTAATLAAALLLPGSTARADDGTAAAEPPVLTSPTNAAATWMANQLTDGSNAKGDHGLTADIVLALASTGTGGDTAAKATDWLEDNGAEYVNRGTPGNVNAGGTAKLALVAEVQHRDATDFGGQDLTGLLLGRMQDNGRFTDKLPTGDMSNQFTQSLAVLALERSDQLPTKAVDFLASTRCADGGFPLSLKADPAKCKSHTDSTGLAVQALLAAGEEAEAKPALDWLEDQQLADGSFRDNGFGTPPGNSNSTALDVQALAAGGRTEAAGKGVSWLKSVQVGCDATAKDRGAVGYAEPKADGTALRATAQVVPALAGKSLSQIDGKGAAPGLEPVACGPGGGDSGGNGGPGGDDGGADDNGGAGGDSGGDSGADSGGGDSGGDDGGATDGTSSGGPGSSGDGTNSGPGSSGSSTSGGNNGGSGGADPASTGGTGGDGSLASTGTSALMLGTGAAALLAAGATAVAVTRNRRSHSPTI